MKGAVVGIESLLGERLTIVWQPQGLSKSSFNAWTYIKADRMVSKIIIGWTKKLMYVLYRLIVLPTVSAFFIMALFMNPTQHQWERKSSIKTVKADTSTSIYIRASAFPPFMLSFLSRTITSS